MAWQPPKDACYMLYSHGENRAIGRGYTAEDIGPCFKEAMRRWPHASLRVYKDVTEEIVK